MLGHTPAVLPRCWLIGLNAVLLVLLQGAFAHATLVMGTLTSNPPMPQPGEPLALTLELVDPAQVPVEDALVIAEFRPQGAVEVAEPVSARFEASSLKGVYETEVTLPEAGDWQLVLRDQTFRQEEARATLSFPVGIGGAQEPLSFIFPPTATGPRNLSIWLLWVLVLPLVAGVVVTVVVLRSGNASQQKVEA